jgi:hypothetical protein
LRMVAANLVEVALSRVTLRGSDDA